MIYALLIVLNLATVITLALAFGLERRRWDAERATLLDRIQAPQLVVGQRMEHDPGPRHVEFDNDADFHKARLELVE